MNTFMNPNDAVFGSLAECYVTIDGNRYCMIQMHDFDSTLEPNVVEVPILGRVMKGHKPAGGKGSWSGTANYNQSVLRKWMLNYKDTGRISPFDIQVSNEDTSSAAGRQTIILRGCFVDKLTLAKFVAGEEILDEEISGTFDDWDMPEQFTKLSGM